MYICLECGQIFAVPGHDSDSFEYCGEKFTRNCECCPSCGGAFAEAKMCPVCDEVYLTPEDEFVCGKCFEDNVTLPELVKFYESRDELHILIDELNEFDPKNMGVLFSRAVCGWTIADKTLENLAQAWNQYTLNAFDFKKYLADKAEERRIKK